MCVYILGNAMWLCHAAVSNRSDKKVSCIHRLTTKRAFAGSRLLCQSLLVACLAGTRTEPGTGEALTGQTQETRHAEEIWTERVPQPAPE